MPFAEFEFKFTIAKEAFKSHFGVEPEIVVTKIPQFIALQRARKLIYKNKCNMFGRYKIRVNSSIESMFVLKSKNITTNEYNIGTF